jgi:hypothetical protein
MDGVCRGMGYVAREKFEDAQALRRDPKAAPPIEVDKIWCAFHDTRILRG